ncbi:hypothetical protein GM1_029_00540 [Gordonia malaquae NBRC 108250]|uniref:Uncharacterized protein n=1 Tax=Gordonia malaquae NBRC 108250 TaxID=1223542 RepID=M3TI16_GORML|nr:hypothetical protein GM1_029_00540 [Gordonia malaquae NBRC 108250]
MTVITVSGSQVADDLDAKLGDVLSAKRVPDGYGDRSHWETSAGTRLYVHQGGRGASLTMASGLDDGHHNSDAVAVFDAVIRCVPGHAELLDEDDNVIRSREW